MYRYFNKQIHKLLPSKKERNMFEERDIMLFKRIETTESESCNQLANSVLLELSALGARP